MLDRDNLQNRLQKIENEIDAYTLAKQLDVHVDDLLTFIQDNILPEYKKLFQDIAFRMPYWNEEKVKEFFQKQIVDLGFLCQSKITEIRDALKKKHNTYGHQTFYNNWLMYRGY